jgi:hypothetical protein
MWDDERSAGVALRTLIDEPAPPPLTTLDEILRRGRRRVLTQRLSVLVLVVVLVTAVSGGVAWLSSLTTTRPADPIVVADVPPWPENLTGWDLVTAPSCEATAYSPAPGDAPIPPESRVNVAFAESVSEVTGTEATLRYSVWEPPTRGYSEVDVPLDRTGAKGSVWLMAMSGAATAPVQAADADAGRYGTCTVPMRRMLASGVVMQLYAPDFRSPLAPVQHLRAYLPDGRLYEVSSAGWSRDDLVAVAAEPAGVVSGGRGRLPLDSRQLADVATRIVELE